MPSAMPETDLSLTACARLLHELQAELDQLSAAGLRRNAPVIDAVDGSRVTIGGRVFDCWASNDYLGLAGHPALAEAAAVAARQFGVGGRASRLLAGTTRAHVDLERALAAWFGAEEALVLPTGYHANLGALTTLAGPEDVIVLDRLAHASLVDAARASRARLRVFRHNDAAHAAALLARAGGRRRLLVTEGCFSMDGDPAPLGELLAAARQHDAVLYLDDAHAAFAVGSRGQGSPEAAGVPLDGLLYMATLGKALGGQGGFLAGPTPWIELLRNRARTHLFTTALAVPMAAAASAALRVLAQEPHRRTLLAQRSHELHAALGTRAPARPSHIVPVRASPSPGLTDSGPARDHASTAGAADARWALELSRRLWEKGIWVPAIRPPTVPRGTSRLRISVTAAHTPQQVAALAAALAA